MSDIATLSLRIDSTGMKEAQQGLEKLSNTGAMVETMAKRVAAAFAAYQVGSWIKDTTLLSARYDTLGVAMNAVGKNAGYTSTMMAFYQRELQATGISALEARDTLTQMSAAQINLADSSKLARIAQDAAVIGNLNSSEAFNRMIQGIRSGQVEILRTIGINVTFEQGYQKLAKSLNKATADLSDYEKMQSRTNQVMEFGKNIAGTYEASMGTAGKQLKSMERYSQDLQLQLGETFQPALNVLVDDMTRALKGASEWMVKNKDATSELGVAMAEVVRQGDGFLSTIGKMAGGGETATGGVNLLTKATQLLSLGIADASDAFRGFGAIASSSIGTVIGGLNEITRKLTGSSLGWGDAADTLKSHGASLWNGPSAYEDWLKRTFNRDRTYADWNAAGMSDSEGGEGGDPYGKIREQQKAMAMEAARKAAEAYAKVLTPLNQALAAEHVLYAQGERAAYAYGLMMKGVHKADSDALMVKWDTVKSLQAWHKTMEDLTRAEENWKRNHNKPKEVNPGIISSMIGGFQTAHDLADPLRWEKDQILNQRAALDRWKDTMPLENYTRALETLRLKDLQLRASEGQTWAIIGQTVVQNADLGSDALQRWMNNSDQLGRTWTTLGQTFRGVIHDMILQMQRAVIQQQLMSPLLKAATNGENWTWLTSLFASNNGIPNGAGGGGGGRTGNSVWAPAANPAGGGGTVQSSVVINMNTGTGQPEANVAGNAAALGNKIRGTVLGILIEERRVGGLLDTRR